ncbi:MAG: hypothetical protein AAB507_02215, partial [Patescibacteria group bacterium]
MKDLLEKIKNKKLKKISIFILMFFMFLGATIANAQDKYTLLQGLPNLTEVAGDKGLADYLQYVFNLGIGIAIALAIVMIVIGGAQYLSTDAVFGKEEGKGKLTNALWGLLLALAAVLILNTINPDI